MSTAKETQECPNCAGCGQIANDDDRTPWKYWADLKPPANLSVLMGLVVPETCESCGGTGEIPAVRFVKEKSA